jgi:GntR family transcriptional regulator
MQIRLEFESRVPIYTQIVDQVRNQVMGGALRPGDQLPTVRELAADLRVNFNTVARAYRLLHDERIISTQQGRGTYVLEPPSDPTGESARLRDARLRDLVQRWLDDAERAGFAPAEIGPIWEESFAAWVRCREAASA